MSPLVGMSIWLVQLELRLETFVGFVVAGALTALFNWTSIP
jgi:hypothetical protein